MTRRAAPDRIESFCIGNDAMDAETLDADFYRGRARLCHKLAEAATAAKPLFARLYLLAKRYEEKAEATETKMIPRPAVDNSRSSHQTTLAQR